MNSGNYRFKITAINGRGVSPASNATEVVSPADRPAKPNPPAASVTGAAQLTVTWSAPNNGGAPITGYTVQQAVNGGAYAVVTSGTCSTTAAIPAGCTATGLTVGSTYTFKVRATNGPGDSDFSDPSAGVIAADVPGTPLAPLISVSGSNQLRISWTEPTDNYSAITGHTVQLSVEGGSYAIVSNGTCASTTAASGCTATNLVAGSTYRFKVRAVNEAGPGQYSNASDPAVARDNIPVVANWPVLTGMMINPALGRKTSVDVDSALGSPGDPAQLSFTVGAGDGPDKIASIEVCLYLDGGGGSSDCDTPNGRDEIKMSWSRSSWINQGRDDGDGFSADVGTEVGSSADQWSFSSTTGTCDGSLGCPTIDRPFTLKFLPAAVMRSAVAGETSATWKVNVKAVNNLSETNSGANQITYPGTIEVRHFSTILQSGERPDTHFTGVRGDEPRLGPKLTVGKIVSNGSADVIMGISDFAAEVAGSQLANKGGSPTDNPGAAQFGFDCSQAQRWANDAAANPVRLTSAGVTVKSSITNTGTTLAGDDTYTNQCRITVGSGAEADATYSATLTTSTAKHVILAQALTFGAAPSVVVGGTGTASATSTVSGAVVVYSSTTTSACTVNSSTGVVTGVTAGTSNCTIAANAAAVGDYPAATETTQTFSIAKGTQAIVFGAAPSVAAGGTGSMSATTTSTSAVTFTTATSSVCTVTTGGIVTGVSAGSCTIHADAAADSNYNAATQADQTFTVTAAPAVGDTGPGGGTIFYVDTSRPAGSRYWEAAVTDWDGNSDSSDPSTDWGCSGTVIGGATGTAIGTGAANTAAIVGETCAGSGVAAQRAHNYSGGGKTDWFLASKDELNQLCKFAHGQSTATTDVGNTCGSSGSLISGFSSQSYWPSSQYPKAPDGVWTQSFSYGNQYTITKWTNNIHVRPIRSF